jgi:hypothetical protein
MPSFCGAFLRCRARPTQVGCDARGLMDALVTARLDVMPDALRPPVRGAVQRGHAGLRRATLRYNGLVSAELAERTQPLRPSSREPSAASIIPHGRRPGFHPQARQAESAVVTGASAVPPRGFEPRFPP